jgi:hypothetical protein
VRVALALILLLLGVFAILLATDMRNWRNTFDSGDTAYAQLPSSAQWSTATSLPFSLAEKILGVQQQLSFRLAAQSFVALHAAGNGVDNGYSESRARGGLEATLLQLAQGHNAVLDSQAENLLGILAFADSQQNGSSGPAPVDRSVADFQAAVQLDPGNEDAKFNLEWLLRELEAKGERAGATSAGVGPTKGHQGANGGTPGRGY